MSSSNKTKRRLATLEARSNPRRCSVRRAKQRLACMPYTRTYTDDDRKPRVRKWSDAMLARAQRKMS